MPSRSELPGELRQKKFLKALKKVGFVINKRGGSGSHYDVKWKDLKRFL